VVVCVAVFRRTVLLAALVALAGCPAGPGGDTDPTPTLTPAPVPEPSGIGPLPTWTDAPGSAFDAPTVDGPALADDHWFALGPYFTETTRLRIDAETRTLLDYRRNLTIVHHGLVTDRRYRGPLSARFVPDATNATSARERNYDGESAEVLRQVVDDRVRTAGGTAAPRFEPAVRTAPGFIETVLDGAPVVNRTADGAYVVAAERASLTPATVPRYLTEPQVVTIRARIAGSGQVERLALTYEATYDGRPVCVEQTVVWGPPAVGDEPPPWVDATPTATGGV